MNLRTYLMIKSAADSGAAKDPGWWKRLYNLASSHSRGLSTAGGGLAGALIGNAIDEDYGGTIGALLGAGGGSYLSKMVDLADGEKSMWGKGKTVSRLNRLLGKLKL